MVPNIRNLTYSNRLKQLGLPTLQYRRLRTDIIQTFKIIKDIDIVDKNKVFPPNRASVTRGHQEKIYEKYSRTNIRKFCFTQRIVDTWNSLPGEVIRATSINIFKNKINKHWKSLDIKFEPDCYGPEAGINERQRDGLRREYVN